MKTGTSSLQAHLHGNDDLLADHGFRYLGWPMRTAARIREQLEGLDPETSVIVSDEGLWHFCGSERSDTPEIANLLADYAPTLVVYFRRPDSYVESWFSQGLKNGLGSRDLISFLSSGFVNSRPYRSVESEEPAAFDSPAFLDYVDLALMSKLAYFRDCFPDAEIIVRPFEKRQLRDGDIVADFFDAARIGDEKTLGEVRRFADENVSPSADTVLFTSLLRQGYGVPEELLQSFLLAHSPPAMAFSTRTRILRFHEAVAINDAMRDLFRDVQATWGGGMSDEFFLDWEIDESTYHVSNLRDAYDEHIRATQRQSVPEPPG